MPVVKYKIINKDDAPNFTSNGEMRMFGKVLKSKQVALSYRRIPAGFKSPHGHTHKKMEEIIYVVDGEIEIRLDRAILTLKKDQIILIPAKFKRGYHNVGKKDAILLIASAQAELVGDDGGTPDNMWWNS